MISTKLLKLLKESNILIEYFSSYRDVDIMIKKLDKYDIKRLYKEYSTLFESDLNHILNGKREHKSATLDFSIISLTIIKHDFSDNNYLKLKKVRFYLDERNEKIIKILQN